MSGVIPMQFKRKIRIKVYRLYLAGAYTLNIATELGLDLNDVDYIIDYMNEINN